MVTEQDSPLTAQKTHPSSRCSPREGTHQDRDRGAGTGARASGPVASCSPQGTWAPPQGRQAQSSRPPATRRRATEGRPPAGSPSGHHQLPRPFARVHEARGVLNSIGLSHEGPPVPFSSQRKGLASKPRGTRERRRRRGEAAGKHGKRRRGRECALEPEREGPRPRGRTLRDASAPAAGRRRSLLGAGRQRSDKRAARAEPQTGACVSARLAPRRDGPHGPEAGTTAAVAGSARERTPLASGNGGRGGRMRI